jgi:uncharacterized repeat protein (TIGR03847 family)
MSRSFDLDEIDVFTAGTVGPKGQRVFFVQARTSDSAVSFRLEKQQVLALAEYLEGMLEDLPDSGVSELPDLDLVEPIVAEWIIGSLGVAYSESEDRVLVWAEQLVDTGDTETDTGDTGVEPETARFKLRREQLVPFVERARELVSAGRPPCPFCGRPLNDNGSFCPCYN